MCASNSAPSKKKEWANRLESRILVIHVCVARSRIASGTIVSPVRAQPQASDQGCWRLDEFTKTYIRIKLNHLNYKVFGLNQLYEIM